jgi:hypothetical protein
MRISFFAPLGALVLCAFGCASPDKTIMSEPPGASVIVNDEPAGLTPLKYDFDFGKRIKYDVLVQKDGFLSGHQVVYSDTLLAQQAVLDFPLSRDPSWNDTAESDIANTWLRIQISAAFPKDTIWQRIFDSVTTRYPSIDQMDKDAGYLQSHPITKTYHVNGDQYSIRTSFVATIASTEPLVYKFKIVSERSTGNDQWVAWHRIFNEDQKLIDELQDRLAAK